MTFVSKAGRPTRGTTFRELYYNEPIVHRQEIVRTGIREAIAGNVRWATWLAQISGELAAAQVNVFTSSPMLDAIAGMREALGLAPLGASNTHAIEGEVVPAGANPAADVSTYVLSEAGQVANEAGPPGARATEPAGVPPGGMPKSAAGPHGSSVATPSRHPTKNTPRKRPKGDKP